MYQNTKISNDELEISELFASEMLQAFKTIFKQVPFREIGPLIMDDIMYKMEMIADECKGLNSQQINKVKGLRTLFHILAGCIINDSKYKEEFLNYKKTL